MSEWRTPPACVLTPDGWREGAVLCEDGRIAAVEGRRLGDGEAPEPPCLLPGFVDLHVHGGDGADTMEGEAAVRRLARFHAAHGTVAMTPTTMTAPIAEIEAALKGIEAARQAPEKAAARILGAHLEGPFISPHRLGAQPPFTIDPDPALARHWCGLCRLAVATVAPELEGGAALIAALAEVGCRVQIGHTNASAAEAERALADGASGFTHLYNAMSGLDHRAPGAAAAALASCDAAEIICDLHHVSAAMIHVARRALPNLYAVTDATAATGMPDGEYRLGRHPVVKQGGRVLLADGTTLAGSALTMDQALRNLVSIGLSLAEGSAMVSARPAACLGFSDLGAIRPGAVASFVMLDSRLAVEQVWIAGMRAV
ncbi:MAG TPA: N-acetylglucosamine-6-phosphate deacetylase [Afifellaceae bacterium]|nr:N-acetylglucosamine-6-phosphate deacetylase [Afifellaceae bacterium]